MNKFAKYSAIAMVATVIGAGAVNAAWGERGQGFGGCDRQAGMMQKGGKGMGRDRDLNLTAEQVRTLAEARLIMRGNDRLKVGEVVQKDDQTYTVQIVTVDGSLVREFDVDKDQGLRRMGRR